MSDIVLVPYDSSWPEHFKREAKEIEDTLGNNCLTIHHIGSTSVPDLFAKPIIDMIPVVRDIQAVDQANTAMAKRGYECKGEFFMPFRRFFKKPGYNIHVYQEHNPEIERHLKFRDWLINNPNDKQEYQTLKLKLAQAHTNDIFSYAANKDSFIAQITHKTGFNQLKMLTALSDEQWQSVTQFRNHYFFEPNGCKDPYTWTFNNPNHKHFLLYQGASIIGYSHIQLWPEQRAALRIIAIQESLQRKQYGTAFITLIEKWLQHQGIQSIHTESSPQAYPFYKNLGYQPMAFNDPDGYESNSEDIPLGKKL